ncbi:MAG: PEP-CTERM sorting domain-containing protein [Pseudomonadota bacterium]|nr:PEP-CTERM sorting domain-containing protein [Pseudomonadota bacterium]
MAGRSARYNGSTDNGQSAWFYDDDQNQTYTFDFSQVYSGHGYSEIKYLGDDGLALGYHVTELGYYAFAWTVEDGFADLGSLIEGGLDADWSYLAAAYRGNAQGQIIGIGRLAFGGGQGAYLLTPVPEPETYALMLVGLGLVGLQSRRKRKVTSQIAVN